MVNNFVSVKIRKIFKNRIWKNLSRIDLRILKNLTNLWTYFWTLFNILLHEVSHHITWCLLYTTPCSTDDKFPPNQSLFVFSAQKWSVNPVCQSVHTRKLYIYGFICLTRNDDCQLDDAQCCRYNPKSAFITSLSDL